MLDGMSGELPSSIVAAIDFVGRGGGLVKALSGYRKGFHTIPDAANDATNAFLAKVGEKELAEEAEALFQAVRAALGYKRKELSLSVGGGLAVLTAKDFAVEIGYAIEEERPERYVVTTRMRELRSAELARTEGFAAVFAGKFSEIVFGLKKGASVEAVVDAIEALDGEGGLSVTYPSDCSECEIRVEGVDAHVRCTGSELGMVFRRAGAPGELIDGFAAVREAFRIDRELAGLIG